MNSALAWWRADRLTWLLLLAFAVTPLFTSNNYYLDTLIFLMLWAAMAACWNIVGGYGGLISLGHAVFFGIGAYTSTLLYLDLGISPWLGIIAGALLSTAFALAIGVICFRLRGPFFSLVTLAFAEVGGIIATNWRPLTKGAEGLSIPYEPGFANMIFPGKIDVYLTFALLLLIYGISLAIERSRLGYRILAVREDEEAARTLAVHVLRTKTIAFAISAALMSMCGTVFAQYVLYIDPASTFSFDISVQVVLLTIVGGSGKAGGPILGSPLLTPLSQALRAWLGHTAFGIHLVVYGLLLIVIVLRVPLGLRPMIDHWWLIARRRFLRRTA